jgi:hypothetical protein
MVNLNGHETGNGGYRQGAYSSPRSPLLGSARDLRPSRKRVVAVVVCEGDTTAANGEPKRARSWKQRIQPRNT